MAYIYAVLGGGRQGTAAAYDMARWGDAERVLIADISADTAQASAKRVNDLIGRPIAEPVRLDVTDHVALVGFLTPADSFLSAGCHQAGLAWVMVIGREDISIASRVERSAEWLMSITMPTRFISRIT